MVGGRTARSLAPLLCRSLFSPNCQFLHFRYGSRSWMDAGPGYEIQQHLRPESYVSVHVVGGAGHHVYVDEAEQFNSLVTDVCRLVDNDADDVDDRNDF